MFPPPPWWAGPRPRDRPRAVLWTGSPRPGGGASHTPPPALPYRLGLRAEGRSHVSPRRSEGAVASGHLVATACDGGGRDLCGRLRGRPRGERQP